MKNRLHPLLLLCFLAGILGETPTQRLHAQIPVDIQIDFSGDQSFLPLFQNAEAIWESILPSYQDGIDTVASGPIQVGPIEIEAGVFAIDGVGNTLAEAGPNGFLQDDSGFVLVTSGMLQFDSADIDILAADGNFQDIIIHELGHVLGFGPFLWKFNGVYLDANLSTDTAVGQYTGAAGVARYNEEFGLSETFIPIENDGGSGTADGHFDEEFFGVALNGDPTVDAGLRFGPNRGELLTGFLNPDVEPFISETTAATFEDIGFNVDFSAVAAANGPAVPEPSSASVLLASLLMTSVRRRRNA